MAGTIVNAVLFLDRTDRSPGSIFWLYGFDEERQQVIRILQTDHRDEKSKSKPLIEHEFALMKQLANVRRIQRGFTFIFLKTATTKPVDYVGELRPPK